MKIREMEWHMTMEEGSEAGPGVSDDPLTQRGGYVDVVAEEIT